MNPFSKNNEHENETDHTAAGALRSNNTRFSQQKTNIVISYGDVQCHNPGRGKIPTPQIDLHHRRKHAFLRRAFVIDRVHALREAGELRRGDPLSESL